METITKQQLLDQLAALTKLVLEDKVVDEPKKRGRKKKEETKLQEQPKKRGQKKKITADNPILGALSPVPKVEVEIIPEQPKTGVHTIRISRFLKKEDNGLDSKYGRKERIDPSTRYNEFYDTGQEFAEESVKKNPNNPVLGVPRSTRNIVPKVQAKTVTKTCYICQKQFEISANIPTTELTRCNNCCRGK